MSTEDKIANERDRMRQYEQGQREQDEAMDPSNRWPHTEGSLVCVRCGRMVRIDRHRCRS